jgi:hypothetical protein
MNLEIFDEILEFLERMSYKNKFREIKQIKMD